jgi:hypothetical protein
MSIKKINPGKPVSTAVGFRPVIASGGVESIITVNSVQYRVHLFTTVGSSSLTIYDAGSDGYVEHLVVAGGGGGGMDMGGGGGGGGVLAGIYRVKTSEVISLSVGNGGFGGPPGGGGYLTDGTVGPQPNDHQFTVSATSGKNSTFGTLTAIGGGYGGSSYYGYTPNNGNAVTGGSGGGHSGYSDTNVRAPVVGTSGQGSRGGQGGGQYYSGGGGGAGGPGADSTNQAHGGPGKFSAILGVDYYWGGGGGGAAYSLANGGNGGVGGAGGGAVGTTSGGAGYNAGYGGYGGSPSAQTNTRGGDAGSNTGGGGGGGSHYNATNKGGEGGSGIVIIRYPLQKPPAYGTQTNPAQSPAFLQDLGYPAGDYWFRSGGMTSAVQLYYSPNYIESKPWVKVFSSPYGGAATLNKLNVDIPYQGLLVQRSTLDIQHTGYFAGYERYNTTNFTNIYTTSGTRTGYRIFLGYAGGHGFYNNIQQVCNWGDSTGAVGAGFNGASCGSFPDGLLWGTGQSISTYANLSGTWEHWVYWS